jgi:hypothetical protein
MTALILILCSVAILTYSYFGIQKKYAEIKDKNSTEKSGLARSWNWFLGMLWPAYVVVFGFGLVVNNLILG